VEIETYAYDTLFPTAWKIRQGGKRDIFALFPHIYIEAYVIFSTERLRKLKGREVIQSVRI